MRESSGRRPLWLAVACAAGLCGSASARAEAETTASVAAELACDPAPRPGRVLCRVTFQAQSVRLVWADALIVESPPEVSPLRARVGPAEIREPSHGTLELALVAKNPVEGTVAVRARAVYCNGRRECHPWSRRITTELTVKAP